MGFGMTMGARRSIGRVMLGHVARARRNGRRALVAWSRVLVARLAERTAREVEKAFVPEGRGSVPVDYRLVIEVFTVRRPVTCMAVRAFENIVPAVSDNPLATDIRCAANPCRYNSAVALKTEYPVIGYGAGRVEWIRHHR